MSEQNKEQEKGDWHAVAKAPKKSRAILIDGGSDREEKRKKGRGTFKQLIVMRNSRFRNWAAVMDDTIMRTDFFVFSFEGNCYRTAN